MGKHETPKGQKSTSEKLTGKRDTEHTPKHLAVDTDTMRGQALGTRRMANPHIHDA